MSERERENPERERESFVRKCSITGGLGRRTRSYTVLLCVLILFIAMNVDSVYCFKVLQGSLQVSFM
jgi:hypothetical protein